MGLTEFADIHPPRVSPCTFASSPILEDTDTGRRPSWEAESLGRSSEDDDEKGRAGWATVGKEPASPTGTSARERSFRVS